MKRSNGTSHSIVLLTCMCTLLAGCFPASRTTTTTGKAARPDAVNALDRARRTLPPGNDRRAVLDEAQTWLGVPYHFGGIDRAGIDCSGFVCTVFRAAHRTLPRTSTAMAGTGTEIDLPDALPGDLVFFNTSGSGVSHVGILLDPTTFIHASTSSGVMVSSLNEQYYRTHLMFARRVFD